jgi:hypothetical protein
MSKFSFCQLVLAVLSVPMFMSGPMAALKVRVLLCLRTLTTPGTQSSSSTGTIGKVECLRFAKIDMLALAVWASQDEAVMVAG